MDHKALANLNMHLKGHSKTEGGTSIYVARHNDCEIVLTKLQTIKKIKEADDHSMDTLLMPDIIKL